MENLKENEIINSFEATYYPNQDFVESCKELRELLESWGSIYGTPEENLMNPLMQEKINEFKEIHLNMNTGTDLKIEDLWMKKELWSIRLF